MEGGYLNALILLGVMTLRFLKRTLLSILEHGTLSVSLMERML